MRTLKYIAAFIVITAVALVIFWYSSSQISAWLRPSGPDVQTGWPVVYKTSCRLPLPPGNNCIGVLYQGSGMVADFVFYSVISLFFAWLILHRWGRRLLGSRDNHRDTESSSAINSRG